VTDIVKQALAHRTSRLTRRTRLARRQNEEGEDRPPLAELILPGAPRASASPLTLHLALVEVHARPTYIRITHAAVPAHAAPFRYLKIAEGCNHPCSFCSSRGCVAPPQPAPGGRRG